MKYKLIAIDMDGTLLNSNNQISKKNREIIFKAINKGIHIVLATGRILKSALQYWESMELSSPIIACNGAIISSGNGQDIIYENPIGIESCKKVIELAEEYGIYYHFYDKDTFYTREPNEELLRLYGYFEGELKENKINIEILESPLEVLDEKKPKVYKFIFIENNRDKLLDFRKKLNNIEGISTSSSWYNNIEVMKEGVSKGKGLEYLIERLNIDKSEIMVIGDNENDISMFKIAGLAVAMENGEDILKRIAHTITDTNNEDGVANAIEKYALNF
ncbi:MAG: HAD family phosphatase [Tissierellia bacterium]|nr:HAD family phosphatase [Tissierellia bacterium]